MHNFALDRIKGQMFSLEKPKFTTAVKVNNIKELISEPISIKRLREIFMEELKEGTISQIKEEVFYKFSNIFEFVDWYTVHQQEFSEEQKLALNTLVQTRDYIFTGCNCKRNEREGAANNYYRDFWANNSKTDLVASILKVTGATKVLFEGIFSFPE